MRVSISWRSTWVRHWLKLAYQCNPSVDIIFWNIDCHCKRSGTLRVRNLVYQNAFAINPNANSRQQCFTCSSRKTRALPTPIWSVFWNQTSDTPFFQPRDHVIWVQACGSVDKNPSRWLTQDTSRNPCFFGKQRRQLFPLLHRLVKKQPRSGT